MPKWSAVFVTMRVSCEWQQCEDLKKISNLAPNLISNMSRIATPERYSGDIRRGVAFGGGISAKSLLKEVEKPDSHRENWDEAAVTRSHAEYRVDLSPQRWVYTTVDLVCSTPSADLSPQLRDIPTVLEHTWGLVVTGVAGRRWRGR